MKVSMYKKYNSVAPIRDMDLFKVLDMVQDGTYSEQIKNVRLYFNDKEKKDIEKKKLPLIGFGGTFSTRGNDNLIKHSGVAVLDFDHLEDVLKTKEEINQDKFTLSSFISPSGDGLKVLVKIPNVDNNDDYRSFYLELQKHYNQYGETDNATKDISRATFISFDPDLFTNVDSVLFTDRHIQEVIEYKEVNIRIEDYDEISERLITWFRKKWTTGENRNNNLFVLSSSFNDYGVPQSTALNYCSQYTSKDFTEREITLLVSSAYKKVSNFGTKSFEDTKRVGQLNRIVGNGGTFDQVVAKLGDSEEIVTEFNKLKESFNTDVFWYVDEKEKTHVSFVRFDAYLKNKGISKYFPYSNSSDFDFIMKDENFIDWIDPTRIKDIVKKDLIDRGEIEIWDLMAKNTSYFKKDILSMLDTIEIAPKRDTSTESFIYYKNNVVKTTKDKIELLNYEDVEDVVWKSQIIDRDILLNNESDGEFKTFIWRISGEDKERYYTLKSVLGYLLHSYQDEAEPKSIIFNDEMISDVPNGGSGKGLIHKALSKIKSIVVEDGKTFDPNGQFAYQMLTNDTQIFLLDDVSKNFNFEKLFSVITEGVSVEKKGMDKFKIPFAESPKLSITTNYTIKGDGDSHHRRVFEVEIANHYNAEHSPRDEFKHNFFSGWSSDEWAKFDNFMIRCIQFYLQNGLVASNKVNLEFRKLKNNLGAEFIEFIEATTIEGRINRKELKDKFNKEYPHLSRFNSSNKFYKKVNDYCNYYDIDIEEIKYNGLMYFEITKNEEEEEVPF